MRSTAEVRWFCAGTLPEAVTAWFAQLGPAPEAQPPRVDSYLRAAGPALNVKVREGHLEVKRRVGADGLAAFHPRVQGRLERWRKWSFPLAADAPLDALAADAAWIDVRKTRWMHAYRLDADGRAMPVPREAAPPEAGCDVELSRVEAAGRTWWSLCFEAYGAEALLADLLHRTAAHVFAQHHPPRLGADRSISYATWLLGI